VAPAGRLRQGVPVQRADLDGNPVAIAPRLLNKLLVRGNRVGRIVEVEAYHGANDAASHAYRGLTKRTAVMFGPAGFLYVYFTYGMHWCANVVCGPDGEAAAVLLRALEPVAGETLMRRRRDLPDAPAWRLCRGPGALCQAMGIARAENGADLVRGRLRLLDGALPRTARVARTVRIGVAYAGPDAARPWRFVVRGSAAVSGLRVR